MRYHFSHSIIDCKSQSLLNHSSRSTSLCVPLWYSLSYLFVLWLCICRIPSCHAPWQKGPSKYPPYIIGSVDPFSDAFTQQTLGVFVHRRAVSLAQQPTSPPSDKCRLFHGRATCPSVNIHVTVSGSDGASLRLFGSKDKNSLTPVMQRVSLAIPCVYQRRGTSSRRLDECTSQKRSSRSNIGMP